MLNAAVPNHTLQNVLGLSQNITNQRVKIV